MHHTVSASLHGLRSIRFFISLLGTMAVLLFASAERLVQAYRASALLAFGAHETMALSAFSSEAMALALPILSALPYTTSFVDDVKSGFVKAYLPRAGLMPYVFRKGLACALAGGLAILLGALLAYGVTVLALLPKELTPTILQGTAETKSLSPIWGRLGLLFASGCFWSITGLLLSSLTGSRYLAYAGPFVVCYVLIILYERYFDKLYVLYPREWLNPSSQWALGAWGAALLLLVFSGALICLFAYWAQRKLVQ